MPSQAVLCCVDDETNIERMWMSVLPCRLIAAPEEIVPWTELKQRNYALQTPGLTFTIWKEGTSSKVDSDWLWCQQTGACQDEQDESHPVEFDSGWEAKLACERTKKKGFYFIRKVMSSPDTMSAIAKCALGITNLSAARKSWSPPPSPPPPSPHSPPPFSGTGFRASIPQDFMLLVVLAFVSICPALVLSYLFKGRASRTSDPAGMELSPAPESEKVPVDLPRLHQQSMELAIGMRLQQETGSSRASGPAAAPPMTHPATPKGRENRNGFLGCLGFGLLIAQNSSLYLTMQLTRHIHQQAEGPSYSIGVVVLCIEYGKLAICLTAIAWTKRTVPLSITLYEQIWLRRVDTIKLSVPALCYTAQNNLLLVAAGFLPAIVLQAINQTKTLWAALFSTVLLGRKFDTLDWLSFVILVLAVLAVQSNSPAAAIATKHVQQPAGVQQPDGVANSTSTDGLHFLEALSAPFIAAFAALLSGFAGVFLELMYSQKGSSLWIRNVQLCLFTIPAQTSYVMYEVASGDLNGLFDGFYLSTWVVIAIQISGGLLTALVLKFAGAMPVTFAAALGLVCTSIISIPLFGYWDARPSFWLGALSVSFATILFKGRGPFAAACTNLVLHVRRVKYGQMP